jgi:hypothetical protein
VYCPPGISWSYTSADGDRMSDSNGAYSARVPSQKDARRPSAARSTPVSSGVPAVAATMAPSEGWEVVPAMESTAPSTMSAPAAAAAKAVATPVPAVSCVCTWMGVCGKAARRAVTRVVAARGLRRPAMSLTASVWAPAPTRSVARAR